MAWCSFMQSVRSQAVLEAIYLDTSNYLKPRMLRKKLAIGKAPLQSSNSRELHVACKYSQARSRTRTTVSGNNVVVRQPCRKGISEQCMMQGLHYAEKPSFAPGGPSCG
jgi:hypothetical protein